MITLKYPNFKKDADLDAHVKLFNYVVKENAKTFLKYIINAFSYMLRDITLDWCHNYMLEFPHYTFLELT
jgi:sugar phosphate permease